jgi:soluble lytic murein transglycosylase-like protein
MGRILMRQKLWIIIRAIILGLIVAALFFAPQVCNKKKSVPDPINVITDSKRKAVNDAMVKWVYEHSSKISRAGCQEIVFEAGKTNKSLLLLAVICAESEFTTTAVSSKGAMGLTQVMPGVWEQHLIKKGIIKERRDLFDIGPSVAAGNEVLSICIKDSKGDVTKALERYLGGQDGIYTKRILSNLGNLYVMVEELNR